MRKPDPNISLASGMRQLSRRCAAFEQEKGEMVRPKAAGAANAAATKAPASVHEVLRSPGEPLDAATRAYFEPRFGHDLSRVRVHTDDRARASSAALQALAYAAGHHIAFAAGAYAPYSSTGRKLLAHELAHVVQQAGAPTLVVRQPKPTPAEEPDEPLEAALEREALLERIAKESRALEQQLEPAFESWEEQQDPFFVREDPGQRRLEAELAKERKQMSADLANAQQRLFAEEKEFLKLQDQRDQLEGQQQPGVEQRRAELDQELDKKEASLKEILQYMEEEREGKREYISDKQKFTKERRRQLRLGGLWRRAGPA